MKTVLKRFLSFDARNVVPEVYAALAAIYLVMLVVTLFSVRNAPLNARTRATWAIVVIFVPILGMIVYSTYALVRADYSFLRSLGLFRKKNVDLQS